MYKYRYSIGDFNTLPIFENWTFTQDEAGGVNKTLDNSFYAWAKMETRQGGRTFIAGDLYENNQSTWIYDMEVTIRYTDNITSASTMVWNNKRYSINFYSIIEEGKTRFIRLFMTMTDDQLVTSGIITPTTPAYVFNYFGIGEEITIQDNSLINKTIIGAFKDGIAYTVIFSGPIGVKEVKYTPLLGMLEFGNAFYPDEPCIIQYI